MLQLSDSLTPLERMSSLLAALSHDIDHPGFNQSFLVATANPLVQLYEVVQTCVILIYVSNEAKQSMRQYTSVFNLIYHIYVVP